MSIVLPMVHTTTANQASGGSVAHRGVGLAFAALVLAMLPAVLDQTILATALPTIAGDLGHLGDVSWLVTAYVVAATATTPLWGKLGDRYGHKRLLQISLTWFVAASALCGAAQDITQLIVVRAAQGVAAGGLMTLAMAAVGDLVAPRASGARPIRSCPWSCSGREWWRSRARCCSSRPRRSSRSRCSSRCSCRRRPGRRPRRRASCSRR